MRAHRVLVDAQHARGVAHPAAVHDQIIDLLLDPRFVGFVGIAVLEDAPRARLVVAAETLGPAGRLALLAGLIAPAYRAGDCFVVYHDRFYTYNVKNNWFSTLPNFY